MVFTALTTTHTQHRYVIFTTHLKFKSNPSFVHLICGLGDPVIGHCNKIGSPFTTSCISSTGPSKSGGTAKYQYHT